MKSLSGTLFILAATLCFTVSVSSSAEAHSTKVDRVKIVGDHCNDLMVVKPVIRQRGDSVVLHAKLKRHSPLRRAGSGRITIAFLDESGAVIKTETARYKPRTSPRKRARRESHFTMRFNGELKQIAFIRSICTHG